MVRAVNPRAGCRPVDDPSPAHLAWDIEIEPAAEPEPEPPELGLARISVGADFEMARRRSIPVVAAHDPS
jgi:hypothetical protein